MLVSFVIVLLSSLLAADSMDLLIANSNQHVRNGPRFTNELPSEVTFTPERGFTLDCAVSVAAQINWLVSSKGNGGMWNSVESNSLTTTSANGSSLTFQPFRPEQFRPDVHAATYRCSAFNSVGRIVSTAVRVRAVVLPPFQVNVDSPRVGRGGTAVFRCSFSADSVRDYVTVTSWIQDNRYDIFLTSSHQDGRHVMLANGELHVTAVRPGDENHLYHCRVLVQPTGQTMTSSSAGRMTLMAGTTKMAPVIVDSVNRIRIWRGQEAVLPCVFHGYPPPKIKWYRSETAGYGNLMLPLVTYERRRHRLIGGTLMIASIVAQDQGRYVCSVNNSMGSAESSTELIYRDKVNVRTDVGHQQVHVVDADTSVTIICFYSGSPRPSVGWLKDGQRLGSSGRVLSSSNGADTTVQLSIASVQRDDEGMYQCVASNDEGDSAQATVQLAIGAFPPRLKETFSRQILHPATSVSLKCLASGIPPPHFSWTLDGSPLLATERYLLGQQQQDGGQVVAHLNISHVRVEDGGNYKCAAENRLGRVEHSASLHIYGAPYVRSMSSVVGVGGRRLELPCPVAGYPIEGITWDKDGRRLPFNGRHRLDLFNGSLTIDPLDKSSDPGVYSCEARGQNGLSARQSLQLNIVDAPHIMAMADSAVLNAGERLALQCAVVKGGMPLTVSWSFNGQTMASNVRLVNEFTATLTIESLTGHHAGLYVCRAANEGGRAESAVHVIVQAPPRITPFAMRNAMVNSRVQLSCVIEEGDGPFHIRWYRDAVHLSTSSAHSFVRLTDFNSYSSILTIDQVTVNHGGNYSCRATNAAGTAVHSTLLRVSVPPLWLNPPMETVQTVSGHSVTLKCDVDGVPSPQVIWSFAKDKMMTYSTIYSTNRTLLANESLLVSPVDVSDAGFYQCEASNGVGNNINAVTALQVHAPPDVNLNEDYVAVRRGSATVLKCRVHGDGPLNVQWRKDSIPLDATRTGSALNPLTSELGVANAAVADEGLYECVASNVYGEDSDSVFLQVQDVPQPPVDVRVAAAGGRTIQLEWKPPATDGGNAIHEFVIFYRSPSGEAVRQERISANQLSASLVDLHPATVYQIYMKASNSLGQSQPSVGLTVTTDEEAPQGPPLQLGASYVTSNSFTLTWSPPDAQLQNGIIQSYLVTIDSYRKVTVSGSEYTAVVAGLRPNTNYLAYVQAVNNEGTGPGSPSVSVKTSESVPEEGPLNVACVSLSSRSLQITWQPPRPELRNGILRGYKIFYEAIDDQLLPDKAETSLTTTELTVFLSALEKFSNYSIQVLAFTSCGDGVKSSPLICTTKEDIPEMPTRLKIVQSGADSLTVSWLAHPSGRIAHYNVYSKEIERGQDVNPQKWTAPSSGRLEIRNLKARRAVFYFQVAAVSGQAGEGPKSSTVTFNFNPANKIVASVVSIGCERSAAVGSRLLLACATLGDAPLQLSWSHDGRQLSDWLNFNSLPWTKADGSMMQILADGSLSVGRLDDGGNYMCQVRNRHGQDGADYLVTVVTPPPAPQLRFAASNWTSITLQWSASNPAADDAGANNKRTRVSSTAKNFVIKYRPRRSQWTEKTLPATWRSVPIGDLNCGTEYEFVIVSSSRVGNSSSSNLVTAKTKGSPPEYSIDPADDDQHLIVTPTSCTVDVMNWQDRGCAIQQFVFRFRLATDSEWIIAGAESPPQQTFLLGGLIPGRDYVVRVTAINAAGSAHKDYALRTDWHDKSVASSGGGGLALLLSDPRVAVPMAVSSLAILLTVVTLLLRYRYTSGDIRPDSRPNNNTSTVRAYADETTADDGGCRKDPMDQVSPYAVFPSLIQSSGGKCQFSSSRRMKTFVVDGSLPVEMSNYAPPAFRRTAEEKEEEEEEEEIEEEPAYDYIVPAGRRNPHQSVFVPIIPARTRHQSSYYHGDWNNQETLALSKRL